MRPAEDIAAEIVAGLTGRSLNPDDLRSAITSVIASGREEGERAKARALDLARAVVTDQQWTAVVMAKQIIEETEALPVPSPSQERGE